MPKSSIIGLYGSSRNIPFFNKPRCLAIFLFTSIGDSREHQYVLYEPFCIFVLGFMIWASSLFTLGIKFLI